MYLDDLVQMKGIRAAAWRKRVGGVVAGDGVTQFLHVMLCLHAGCRAQGANLQQHDYSSCWQDNSEITRTLRSCLRCECVLAFWCRF